MEFLNIKGCSACGQDHQGLALERTVTCPSTDVQVFVDHGHNLQISYSGTEPLWLYIGSAEEPFVYYHQPLEAGHPPLKLRVPFDQELEITTRHYLTHVRRSMQLLTLRPGGVTRLDLAAQGALDGSQSSCVATDATGTFSHHPGADAPRLTAKLTIYHQLPLVRPGECMGLLRTSTRVLVHRLKQAHEIGLGEQLYDGYLGAPVTLDVPLGELVVQTFQGSYRPTIVFVAVRDADVSYTVDIKLERDLQREQAGLAKLELIKQEPPITTPAERQNTNNLLQGMIRNYNGSDEMWLQMRALGDRIQVYDVATKDMDSYNPAFQRAAASMPPQGPWKVWWSWVRHDFGAAARGDFKYLKERASYWGPDLKKWWRTQLHARLVAEVVLGVLVGLAMGAYLSARILL